MISTVESSSGIHPDRKHILVVDDERATLEMVSSILAQADYQVTCRDTIDKAQRALDCESFDLVLTDLYIGESGLGTEIASIASARRPRVPVVLLTGRPSFGGAREALRNNICEILVKPVNGEDLIAVCEKAIETAHLQRKAQALEAQNNVLATIIPRIVEAKDPTTSGHSARVVDYTDRLAKRCGVSLADRESLRLASLMHDVGKVGVPQRILTKNGPLTTEERKVIETHPEMARAMLEPLEDSKDVQDWVYQHHERWDGGGYPNGLRQDEVALPGRILILAEVYDALAEARSYKPAWPVEKIIGLFRAEAGKQFDPDLSHLVADGLERDGKRFFGAGPNLLF